MLGFNTDKKESKMNVLEKMNTPVAVKPVTIKPAEQPKQKIEVKKDILDIASEKIVNNRDITDTVTMPRAIFKGYFCFTAGTAINAMSGMVKKQNVSKGLAIAGTLLSILGTFNFVKPFLIKDKNQTETGK